MRMNVSFDPSSEIFNHVPMVEREYVGAPGQFDPLLLGGTDASGASGRFGVPTPSKQVGFRPASLQRSPLATRLIYIVNVRNRNMLYIGVSDILVVMY